MPHPLRRNINLVLYIKRKIGDAVRNPQTGNYEQETETVKIECSVQQNYKVEIRDQAGSNLNSVFMEGFLVNPKYMPSFVKFNDKVDAELLDRATGNKIEGKFLLQITPQDRFKVIQRAIGSEVSGYFQAY